MFQSCTKEKIRPFDDADEEEDIWEDKEINYATQVKSRTRFGVTSTLRSDVEGGALRRLGSPDLECFPDCRQILDNSRSEDGDKDSSLPQSPGWVASFEDDFNFKADFAGVAIDSGSGVWGGTTVPLNDSEDKGWATFTDFQPFCCSDSGARCSSPVDSENSEKQNQDKVARGSAACVWSVCGARKAPLVASDSSSSGSDSEDEEERSDSTGDKENATDSIDTKTEKTLFNR
ncbi:serine/threonine-protein phosphatase 6 regulatory subunit 2 [Tachysurus ichikawai]